MLKALELEVLLCGDVSPRGLGRPPQGTRSGFLSGVEASAYFSQVNCTSGKKRLIFYKIPLK